MVYACDMSAKGDMHVTVTVTSMGCACQSCYAYDMNVTCMWYIKSHNE